MSAVRCTVYKAWQLQSRQLHCLFRISALRICLRLRKCVDQFDFLGKDSIRYNNTVEVEEKVYKAIGDFKKGEPKVRSL